MEIKKFGQASDDANFGIAMIDLEGNLAYINRYFARIHGYSTDEMVGKHFSICHNEEQMNDVNRLIEKLKRQGSFSSEEVWHTKKDGTVFPMLMNAVAVRDDDGAHQFLSLTAIDITNGRKTEEKLRERERKFEDLCELLPLTVIECDSGGRITFSNSHGYRFIGYSPEDIERGLEVRLLFISEERDKINSDFQTRLSEKDTQGHEYILQKKNGDTCPVLVFSSPIVRDETPPGIRCIILDISELKKKEEVIERQRLDLRRLSLRLVEVQENEKKVIARELHDSVAQKIAVAKIKLENAKVDDTDRRNILLDEASGIISEAAADLRNLSGWLRPRILEEKSLTAAVKWLLEQLSMDMNCSFEVLGKEFDIEPRKKTNIFRILQEILLNIHKHSRADKIDIAIEFLRDQLAIRVVDNGRGFTYDKVSKERHSHIGSGLLNIEERIEMMEGKLEIDTGRNEGTSFNIRIPMDETLDGQSQNSDS